MHHSDKTLKEKNKWVGKVRTSMHNNNSAIEREGNPT